MRSVQTLILGAGPSGLALAYQLQGNTLVLEKEARVGGLCRSTIIEGAAFDIGGHSFHTSHPEVDTLIDTLMDEPLSYQQRDARVFSHGTIIPYPFQKHFNQIPDVSMVEACEAGLRQANRHGSADNFEDYIVGRFGPGIAEHFMLPYNRKLWARDLRTISTEWTSERVADHRADSADEIRDGIRRPLHDASAVGYPQHGGFETIYESFVPHVPALEINQAVTHIDPLTRTAETASGERTAWDVLASTLPLPVLLRLIDGAPAELIAAADRLGYVSLRVLYMLTAEPLKTEMQRLYVASPDVPPHKIALNSNSSASLRANRHHAIMAEVSIPPGGRAPEDAAERTIRFLCDVGILKSPSDIAWHGHEDVRYAYPVYTHERGAIISQIKDWLAQRQIFTLGRFGEWEYINSDQCVAKALALGRELRARFP